MVALKWDEWSAVEQALEASRAAGEGTAAPALVCVCFVQSWSPPAAQTASVLERFRAKKLFPFAAIFLVEYDAAYQQCAEHGVSATPTVCCFWRGEPLVVRRKDWADDQRVVGSASKESWAELIKASYEAASKGLQLVQVSF